VAIFEKIKSAMRNIAGGNGRNIVQPVDDALQQTLLLIEEGNSQEDAGQLEHARALYEKAVRMAPKLARTHLNLGNVLLAMDQPSAAVEAYSAALTLQPDWATAYFNMGNALVASNRPKDALGAYERAITLRPDFVDALVARGNVQGDLKDLESAVISYQRALELNPSYAEVRLNLGNITKAVTLKSTYVTAQIDLANTYRELGEITKAVEIARLAIELDPDNAGAWSLLFFCLSDSEDIDQQTLFAEHRRFGEHFEPKLKSNWQTHSNLRDPERILRVGIVSGDLRNHAVASFFEPVLLLLLEMPALSIHVYDTSGLEDGVTRRLKAKAKHWNDVETLAPDVLAKAIRQDQMDVLIDLSGHTPANRLLTFARKPAPIQMSWIGYPGTTGLKTMDYYVADRHFLPFGKYDDMFSEKILRIPANAPFQPSAYAPDVNALPALRNGFFTFASFNRIDKVGRNVIALWSRLLNATPNSRMLIGGMPPGDDFEQLTDWFAREGVSKDRLEFHHRSGMAEYLAMHHQVDMCLDTFPYGGGTTTCHALWMGVPTLTLVGTTPTAEAGRSIFSHINLQTVFCAHNPQEFINKGLWCTEHLEYMQDLRFALREQFHKSALSQPSIVAGGLELAIRHAWRRWCADMPPISFEVTHDSGIYAVNDANQTIARAN